MSLAWVGVTPSTGIAVLGSIDGGFTIHFTRLSAVFGNFPSDERALREMLERWSDHAARVHHARNHVAAAAPRSLHVRCARSSRRLLAPGAPRKRLVSRAARGDRQQGDRRLA